jgi:hypothetical protein
LNPGRRGGKPATNRLSYGAAYEEVNSDHLLGQSDSLDNKYVVGRMDFFFMLQQMVCMENTLFLSIKLSE